MNPGAGTGRFSSETDLTGRPVTYYAGRPPRRKEMEMTDKKVTEPLAQDDYEGAMRALETIRRGLDKLGITNGALGGRPAWSEVVIPLDQGIGEKPALDGSFFRISIEHGHAGVKVSVDIHQRSWEEACMLLGRKRDDFRPPAARDEKTVTIGPGGDYESIEDWLEANGVS